MAGISDIALWRREYQRQFACIKVALHSLRVQTEELRNKKPTPKAVREMAHTFAMVDIAFNALNNSETDTHEPDEELIPGPKGRREFLSDLKHGEVRT